MSRVVITGAGGMLGQDVARELPDAVALTRADLDVTDADAVRAAIGPEDTVINCAAWTDVDGAESSPDRAAAVNEGGARNVAEAAGRLVHVSTDYVFDGSAREPYVESAATGPLQEYGRSKLRGERAIAEVSPNHLIVRSSWLFGTGGANFVATMLRLGDERDVLRVVDDQVGAPTFTGHLARALIELAGSDGRGLLHVTGSGECSWYGFARAIFERAGIDVTVEPCTTAEFPRPAARPAYSVLASERGAPELPRWREGLEAYLGVRA